ncbi:hypothetical protein DX926_11215 [Bacillus atrophaeus]|nr:hypothetical protein DX926_11215 [Bacillus atrophaeus]
MKANNMLHDPEMNLPFVFGFLFTWKLPRVRSLEKTPAGCPSFKKVRISYQLKKGPAVRRSFSHYASIDLKN